VAVQLNLRNDTRTIIHDSGKPAYSKVAFVLCQSCFWCASELTTSSNYRCPSCGGAVHREELNLEVIRHDRQ